jgi:hypothetical protein
MSLYPRLSFRTAFCLSFRTAFCLSYRTAFCFSYRTVFCFSYRSPAKESSFALRFHHAALLALTLTLATATTHAQSARDLERATPAARTGETQEQHGKRLLDEMVTALGGNAWLNKKTASIEGQTAPFFQGQPSGGVARFVEFKKFAEGSTPELARIEFISDRGMIEPGTVRQVAHVWTADNGYEFTYKGRTTLPVPQVTDYLRRRAHSIEEVIRTWIKAPGVVVIYDGAGMRDRRPVDKVSILSDNNDAVTIELEQDTHLPLQRAFEWRNLQFKDHDLDEEVYGDWKFFQGIGTPMNMTRYRNGDMVDQTFYKKIQFNQPLSNDLFDIEKGLKKK